MRVFGVEAFDFIYMKNALDHCQSPREVFRQMAQTLQPGGYIFILGTVKEATARIGPACTSTTFIRNPAAV